MYVRQQVVRVHLWVQVVHGTLFLLGRNSITWEGLQEQFDVDHVDGVDHLADEQDFVLELAQDELGREECIPGFQFAHIVHLQCAVSPAGQEELFMQLVCGVDVADLAFGLDDAHVGVGLIVFCRFFFEPHGGTDLLFQSFQNLRVSFRLVLFQKQILKVESSELFLNFLSEIWDRCLRC